MGVKELYNRYQAVQETKAGVVFKNVISIVVSFVSMTFVILAFQALVARTDDIGLLVKNWASKPIVGIDAVPFTDACPTGYDEVSLPSWPGAQSGPCACPYNSGDQSSSMASCNSNQTAAGCENQRSISSIPPRGWRGEHKLCVQREGQAQAVMDDELGFMKRPEPVRLLTRDISLKLCLLY